MALTAFAFVPPTGFEDGSIFPTNPGTEAQKRAALMTPLNQVKAYMTDTLKPYVDGKADIAQEAWTDITFQSPWTAYIPASYGNPRYMKDQMGFVHVEGTIKSGTSGTTAFILPVGYRPQYQVNFPGVDSSGAARILVYPDGKVEVNGSGVSTFAVVNLIFKAV